MGSRAPAKAAEQAGLIMDPDSGGRTNGRADRRRKVVLAGGGGFVSRALIHRLADQYDVRVLTRVPELLNDIQKIKGVQIQSCDLFSLLDAEEGVKDVDYAIFLLHSRLSAARLTQARFQDLAMILADNFAWACRKANVRQIVYLGDMDGVDRPRHARLNRLVQGRRELERTLGGYGTSLTTIRADFILGPGGLAFRVFSNLARRLPVILCPRWMKHKVRPAALADVVEAIANSIGDSRTYNSEREVGFSRVLSYRELTGRIAGLLGKKRLFLPLPVNMYGISRKTLSFVSGVPQTLVSSVINATRYDFLPPEIPAEESSPVAGTAHSLESVLKEALEEKQEGEPRVLASGARLKGSMQRVCAARNVRSVQRLHLPRGKTAYWVSRRYGLWLEKFHFGIMNVRFDRKAHKVHFELLGKPLLILRLSRQRSNFCRALYYITGGILSSRQNICRGRQEFRTTLDGKYVITAIHEFNPRLPWHLYRHTQAHVHLWTMKLFNRYLVRYDRRKQTYSAYRPREAPVRELSFFSGNKKSDARGKLSLSGSG